MPLIELAVRRLEYGATSALVVWRVDRFGRSLNDELQIIERIRSVGGGFYSVHDGLDISTDAGRLALRILLSVAEFQLDGVREAWETARAHAVRRGVYLASLPVGYRKTRAGRLRPHPTSGPVITEVYRRRAAGESLPTLCRLLESEGVKTARGNPGWNPSTLAYMLGRRAYLGEVGSGRHCKEHAHVALTDAVTWSRAQKPINGVRASPLPALVVGIVRCAGCSYRLAPHIHRPTPDSRPNRKPYLAYKCAKHHAGGRCPAPAHSRGQA